MSETQIDSKLAAALKDAKKGPLNFAFVAKSATESVLLVSKKDLTTKDITAAKVKLGGTAKVTEGRVFGDEKGMVFEVAKEPPSTLAKQLRTTIIKTAGLTLNVETRTAPDPAAPAEGAAEGAAEAAPAAAATAPATPTAAAAQPAAAEVAAVKKVVPPAATEAAEWQRRRQVLEPQVLQALKEKRGDPSKIRSVFAFAQEKAEHHDYPKALAGLDSLEKLLAAPAAAPKEAAAPASNAAADALKAALEALKPAIKQALVADPTRKDELLGLAAAFQRQLTANQLDEARKTRATLEDLLKAAPAAAQKASEPPKQEAQAEAPERALDVWRQAKETVDGQIANLQAALRQTKEQRLIRIAEYGLHGVTGRLQVGLQAALMDYDNGGGDKARTKALNVIGQYREFLKSNKIVALCEENPFKVKMTLRDTLGKALATLEKQLQG